jgi:hypothetical protein
MADPVGALIQLWNKQRQDRADQNTIQQQKEASFLQGLGAIQKVADTNRRYPMLNPRLVANFKQDIAAAVREQDPQKQLQAIMEVGAKYNGFMGMDKQINTYINALGKVRSNSKSTIAEQKFGAEQKAKDIKQQQQEDMLFDSAEQTLSTIAEIEKGLKYFGAMGDLPPYPAEYGKKNWLANVNRLKDKLVVDLMLKLKSASPTGSTGFGQLSEKEGMRLENAATALNKGLKEEDAQRYLNQIKAGAEKILSSRQVDGTEMPHPLDKKGNDLNSLKLRYGLR